jgi:hypothetical protein
VSRAVEFVYGNFGGLSPCVLKLETAQRIAAEGDDISYGYETSFGGYIERCRSRTNAYDREWVDDLVAWLEEFEIPLDSEFSVEQVPGYGDGWFPTNARTAMLDDMPEDVTESGVGRIVEEMGGIPMYLINEADLPGIRTILERLGHTVREDQELFDRMACG